MTISEVMELSAARIAEYKEAAALAALPDGGGEVYACTGDRYFPNLEFMTRQQVEEFITWADREYGGDNEGVWDCVEEVVADA